MEEWKPIEEYDGKYLVSNYGRVKSVWHYHYVQKNELKKVYTDKLINIADNGNGYQYVSLCREGKKKNHYVHRLVADAFLEKKLGDEVVNHKDFNTSNNRADNLEWCSQKENVNYSVSHNHGKMKPRKTSTGEKYIQKREYGSFAVVIRRKEKRFKTMTEAIAYRDNVLKEMEKSWNCIQ